MTMPDDIEPFAIRFLEVQRDGDEQRLVAAINKFEARLRKIPLPKGCAITVPLNAAAGQRLQWMHIVAPQTGWFLVITWNTGDGDGSTGQQRLIDAGTAEQVHAVGMLGNLYAHVKREADTRKQATQTAVEAVEALCRKFDVEIGVDPIPA